MSSIRLLSEIVEGVFTNIGHTVTYDKSKMDILKVGTHTVHFKTSSIPVIDDERYISDAINSFVSSEYPQRGHLIIRDVEKRNGRLYIKHAFIDGDKK